jgi:hypothetical protein
MILPGVNKLIRLVTTHGQIARQDIGIDAQPPEQRFDSPIRTGSPRQDPRFPTTGKHPTSETGEFLLRAPREDSVRRPGQQRQSAVIGMTACDDAWAGFEDQLEQGRPGSTVADRVQGIAIAVQDESIRRCSHAMVTHDR